MLNFPRNISDLARRPERRGCCCGSPAGYVWGGLCDCVAVLAVDCVLRTAILM